MPIGYAKYTGSHQTFFKNKIQRPVNKYGNKKTIIGEKKFDSQSEGNLYVELTRQQRQGLIKEVICQAKEEFFMNGEHITNYYVDFKLIHNDDRIEFIEHKSQGTVTDVWKMKWKMLLAKYKDEISRGDVICNINWYQGYWPKTFKGGKFNLK